MKKYLKELKGFITGMLITSILLFNISVFAENPIKTVSVLLNAVNVKVNEVLMTSNNLMYNNKLYIQVDEVAKLLGKGTTWDNTSKTYSIKDKLITDKIQNTNNKFFDLTEKDINDAFEISKRGYYEANTYIKDNYNIAEKDNGTAFIKAEVTFNTSYAKIIFNKAYAESKYSDYTLINAKDDIKRIADEKQIEFSFDLKGSSIDFHKYLSYVLIQGDNKITPEYKAGVSGYAYMTANWPNYPAYAKSVSVYFDTSKIDFNKKAELILIQAPESEKHYEIDFSKYK
jgi:hypothetical protein